LIHTIGQRAWLKSHWREATVSRIMTERLKVRIQASNRRLCPPLAPTHIRAFAPQGPVPLAQSARRRGPRTRRSHSARQWLRPSARCPRSPPPSAAPAPPPRHRRRPRHPPRRGSSPAAPSPSPFSSYPGPSPLRST